MGKPRVIYRTSGDWMATLYEGNLFDPDGEWVAWLDGDDVYTLDGEYVGYISRDGRLLRKRVLPYRKHRRPPTRRPPFKAPKTIPLPPMFAELPYDTIDVFEENPDLFATISELRPDAGERPIRRLTRRDPRLALAQELRHVEQNMLEEMTYGIVYSYGVTEPPVPIEAMVARVPRERAGRVALAAPAQRLRLAEGLVERLGRSDWVVQRGYGDGRGFAENQVAYAARALLMPRPWVLKVPERLRWPPALAQRFRVPEAAVVLRLHDLE